MLVGEGPHALVAARRAAEIVSASGGALSLTLFNVQEPLAADEDSELTPEERGENVIEELAKRAGIEYMNYTSHVEVVVDVEETILEPHPTTIQAVLEPPGQNQSRRPSSAHIPKRLAKKPTLR